MAKFLLKREPEDTVGAAFFKKALLLIMAKQGHLDLIVMLMGRSDRPMVEIAVEAVSSGCL